MAMEVEGTLAEPRRTPRARKTPEDSERIRDAKATRGAQQSAIGTILPACSTTAAELAEQWNVARDDAETVSVKILRQKLGTDEKEMIDSVPLVLFDMRTIAGNYGPGTYYFRGAAGRYAKNAAKLVISEAYARAHGWGKLPATAADALAARTISQAAVAPTDPVELLAAVQQVVRRELEAQRGPAPMQAQPNGLPDPMQAMEREMERMQRMMAMMETLRESARVSVRAELGITPKEEVEAPSIWAELIKAAVPLVTAVINRPMDRPQPQAGQVREEPATTAGTLADGSAQAKQEAIPMPALSKEEQEAIAGAVNMLRPFAAYLLEMASKVADDQAIAETLTSYIPDAMVPSLEALAAIVAKHGPAVLGMIHPGLAVARWASILPLLVEACK